MALLMIDHALRYANRHPDGDVELQLHCDLRDGDCSVRTIRSARLSAENGVGDEIGNAFRVFAGRQGRHIGWRAGRIERAACKIDRLLGDNWRESFLRLLARWDVAPNEPAE